MKIAHLILGLGSGGAENMLLKLATSFNGNKNIEQVIFTVTNEDYLLEKFKENGITVVQLSKSGITSKFFILPIFVYHLYRFKPDVLQCWMYHAEALGLISKLFYWKKLKLYWNIRCTGLDWKNRSIMNGLIFRMLSIFSKTPKAIISNTSEGIINHKKAGYKSLNMIKIGNGFYFPNNLKRIKNKEEIFRKYNIPLNSITIVMVARFNYVKDHNTLIKAFDKLLINDNFDNTFLILIGDNGNKEIFNMINNAKSIGNIRMLGNIDNVIETIQYFDIGVLTSVNEGFPNVIGEYIMSRLPIISSDVGEIKNIVIEKGAMLFKSGDYNELHMFLEKMINLPEEKKKEIVDGNIFKLKNEFSIDKITKKYLDLYYA